MTAIRLPPTMTGSVLHGAVIWNGTAWVNALLDANSFSASVQSRLPLVGVGSPQSSITAPVGTLYTDLSGGANTTLWVKESGSGTTGWTAK